MQAPVESERQRLTGHILVNRVTVRTRRGDADESGNLAGNFGDEIDIRLVERVSQATCGVDQVLAQFAGMHLVAQTIQGLAVRVGRN